MEWTFDQLKELCREVGAEFKSGKLVSPPQNNPLWHEPSSWLLTGVLHGLEATLYDNNVWGSEKVPAHVKLSLGEFLAHQQLETLDYAGVSEAVKKLLSRADVQRVLKAGGLKELQKQWWEALLLAVENAGGSGTPGASTVTPTYKLPGYGNCQRLSGHRATEKVELFRNGCSFKVLEVNLATDDFQKKAAEVVDLLLLQQEVQKKKQYTPLFRKLNKLKVHPVVESGVVTRLVDRNNEPLRHEELKQLGLDPKDLGTLEPHPEGADRGGYVAEVHNNRFDSARYCEGSGQWE